MNLVLDIGNSRLKYGIFLEGELKRQGAEAEEEQVLRELSRWPINHAIVSSVAKPDPGLLSRLPHTGQVVLFGPETPVPIRNLYHTPLTLGADRLAAAVGVAGLFPGQDCLVIDAGTCITYDFTDRSGAFHGGSISPGIRMKFRALHTFTGRLPLVEGTGQSPLTGRNTPEALQSGVEVGTVAEMEGFIARYRQQYPQLKVVLCGGDAVFFESKLKAPIFVIPELVLVGLHRILEYNV